MPIRTRRWNDPKKPGDGLRVLVCRYRPRALPKKDETWDAWWKELAPSVELHADYYGKHGRKPITLEEYKRRFLAEMKAPAARARLAELKARSDAGEAFTLLCSSHCTDPEKCHRTLLVGLLGK